MEDGTRVRWLRPDEEIPVLEVMPSPFREMAKLAALTLMRQGELRTLRREMVHLEQGTIFLPRAKAGARPVTLSAAAQKILRHQLETHGVRHTHSLARGIGDDGVGAGGLGERAALASGHLTLAMHLLSHDTAPYFDHMLFIRAGERGLGGWICCDI